jgi:hypothetical protein
MAAVGSLQFHGAALLRAWPCPNNTADGCFRRTLGCR